eukprot:TRINITY_DN2752_c0_g1_i1.p1 TRINITY_DN2752_c0_g1~~TRINITY_DN2752_c0_g1_i1.p1  ORF type:complete len:564 (+),score=103.19 TRINITY_DN2752_c0_g1_i1:240-1931(+)
MAHQQQQYSYTGAAGVSSTSTGTSATMTSGSSPHRLAAVGGSSMPAGSPHVPPGPGSPGAGTSGMGPPLAGSPAGMAAALGVNTAGPGSNGAGATPPTGGGSAVGVGDEDDPDRRLREIYTVTCPWSTYALSWSNRRSQPFRLAVGSFMLDYANCVRVVQLVDRSSTVRGGKVVDPEGGYRSSRTVDSSVADRDAGGAAAGGSTGGAAAPGQGAGAAPGGPEKEKEGIDLEVRGQFEHPYPATKVLWYPERVCDAPSTPDLLATTGDYLRLWEVTQPTDTVGGSGSAPAEAPHPISTAVGSAAGAGSSAYAGGTSQVTGAPSGPGAQQANKGLSGGQSACKVDMKVCLNNNKKSDFCAPLTSFDWNVGDPRLLATASIDTTVSAWDIEAQTTVTQLIAHEKEVFDIAFARGVDVFATAGGDGSVRLFDLRFLDHSNILYESDTPLVRVAWNRLDSNYIATFALESRGLLVLDVRAPSVPLVVLKNPLGALNAAQWPPHSACHICTAAEDSHALIWDLSQLPQPVEEPILAYTAESAINSLSWSSLHPQWIAIGFGWKVQTLRV